MPRPRRSASPRPVPGAGAEAHGAAGLARAPAAAYVAARICTDQCLTPCGLPPSSRPRPDPGAPHGGHRSFPAAPLPELRLVEQPLRLPKLIDGRAERALPDPRLASASVSQGRARPPRREQQFGAGDAVVLPGPGLDSRATAPQSSARARPGAPPLIADGFQQRRAARVPLPGTGRAVLLDQRPLQVGAQNLVVAEGLAVVVGRGEQLLLLQFVQQLRLPVVSSSASHNSPVSVPSVQVRAGTRAGPRQLGEHVARQVGANQFGPAAEILDRPLPVGDGRRRWPGGTVAARRPTRRCAW